MFLGETVCQIPVCVLMSKFYVLTKYVLYLFFTTCSGIAAQYLLQYYKVAYVVIIFMVVIFIVTVVVNDKVLFRETSTPTTIITGVEDFEVKDEFLFAVKKVVRSLCLNYFVVRGMYVFIIIV